MVKISYWQRNVRNTGLHKPTLREGAGWGLRQFGGEGVAGGAAGGDAPAEKNNIVYW